MTRSETETQRTSKTGLASFRASDGFVRWDRWTAWPLVVLGLVFLVVLILPLAHPMTAAESTTLDVLNLVIWALFALDYAMRVYLAPRRRTFVTTHLLDLIVVAVPFLRPFRLLRLFAIVVSTTRRAGGLVVRRVTLFVIGAAVIVMTVSAVVVYDAEHQDSNATIKTLGGALWWAMTTVTGVGYGDEYPVTTTGRLMASVLMVTGLALVGTITAAVAAWFVQAVRGSATADETDLSHQRHEQMVHELEALTAAVTALQTDITELQAQSVGAKGPRAREL